MEMKMMDYLKENELIHSKRLMDYKDLNKHKVLWDKFCTENDMEKIACKRWFQSQMTIYRKLTHMESGQGALHLIDRQKWLKTNFGVLNTHIVIHFLPRVSPSHARPQF